MPAWAGEMVAAAIPMAAPKVRTLLHMPIVCALGWSPLDANGPMLAAPSRPSWSEIKTGKPTMTTINGPIIFAAAIRG